MINNFFKFAFRSILKHKTYSIINIAGLSFGIACTILIALWIKDELSFDSFHENADQIYRVVSEQHYSDGTIFPIAVTPANLGPAFKEEYPGIINFARLHKINTLPVRYGDKKFYESRFARVDPSFFEIFTFSFLKGNPATALSNPNSVVITQKIAEKYFGNKDPIGKTLITYYGSEVVVTGVLKNTPSNSHVQFDFLGPFEEVDWSVGWNSNNYYTYVHATKNANIHELNSKIYEYYKTIFPAVKHKLFLQPVKEIHLYSNFNIDIDGSSKDKSAYVYIFGILAIFVLLIACINFMNLSSAGSGKRVKEISLRKISGAKKTDLIIQFYGETFLFSFCAVVIALFLVELALPAFNNLSTKNLSLDLLKNSHTILFVLGITLFTTLMAGSYPAVFLSSFQPADALKSSSSSIKNPAVFRKVLVVIQFSISITVIAGTLIVNKQLQFMQDKKLGFNKDKVLYLHGDINYTAFKTEAIKNPGILDVSAASCLPTYTPYSTNDISWEGKNKNDILLMHHLMIDFDYIDMFEMKISIGRNFSRAVKTDATENYIVNETAAKLMGLKDPVGKRFNLFGNEGKIIGVVKDFNFKSLHNKIEPLILRINNNDDMPYTLIKISPQNVEETLNSVEKIFRQTNPHLPFEYKFLDENIEQLYRSEKNLSKIFNYFSLLAILVSCLGLLGLAYFTAEQKTKEIGIRKVLGASVARIIFILSKNFLKWVMFANAIAWPISWLAANKWLQGFAYRIEVGAWVFIFAGGAALIIALFTISSIVIKAATNNPIKAIRTE